ncbi:MAG: hypothetical protein HFG89_05970 [Dorea sp.]|nr:hypothetical protein [Dorea sp.]
MTNREKYKQAFSVLQTSGKISLEVEKMAVINKRAKLKAAAAVITTCLILAGGSGIVYATDIGGIQRTIQLWIEGDQTNATFEYNSDGSYNISIPSEDGEIKEYGGGGIAYEPDGTERPLTEDEVLEQLNRPEVEYKDNGTVWVYYYDQKIEITDKFEDDICYLKLSNGDENLYMTIKYQNGWCSSPHKYESPNSFN